MAGVDLLDSRTTPRPRTPGAAPRERPGANPDASEQEELVTRSRPMPSAGHPTEADGTVGPQTAGRRSAGTEFPVEQGLLVDGAGPALTQPPAVEATFTHEQLA